MPVLKNKKTGGHAADYLLRCGCMVVEPVDSAIDVKNIGEQIECKKHGKQAIVKATGIYWLDADE